MTALKSISPPALSWEPEGVADALSRAVALIRNARTALVVSHEKPDGDAIGCTLGAALILEQAGLTVTRFNVDPAPGNLGFLPQVDALTGDVPPDARFDLTLVLDCAVASRVGRRFPDNGWGEQIVCVDHHQTYDAHFADVLVRDTEAASCTELVYRLLVALGGELTPEIATCIFCGVHTDTGSFRYDSTVAGTMGLFSHLLKTGISVWTLASHLYESRPASQLRLLALALQSLHVSRDGKLATLLVSQADIAAVGAREEDADGFINYARSVAGVEVAAQMTESADGLGYRVSFRSRGAIDVSLVAEQFGGGGHRNAAGCTVAGTLVEVREALESALVAVLASDG